VACGALLPASAPAALDLSKVASFNSPTYVTSPPDSRKRLFVTERPGKIRVVTEGKKRSQPFLDISGKVGTASEGGLLSMAFSPGYKKNRRFYVYYVEDGSQNIRIDEYRTRRSSPTRADKGSGRKIIEIGSPDDTHKGGQLQMTPGGYLLAGTGDGGDYNSPSKQPQKRKSLLGKILRIKPQAGKSSKRNWRPHPDNPFAGKGKRKGSSAIMALGLRNPWRFSLDSKRPGRIAIGDVGHSRTEEVNAGSLDKLSGANFGWPCYEGRSKFKGCKVKRHTAPRFTYPHSKGRCSITGGYVNRAPGLPRQGEYFYGDFCTGEIRAANLTRGSSQATGLNVPTLVSFGEDAKGNLYTVSLAGAVKRIVNR
jgi:glucose/arabinose dehydrogenase